MLDRIHYDQRYVSLLEVYRSGSYTAAGSALALTPSAVAQQIRSVERELTLSCSSAATAVSCRRANARSLLNMWK